MRRTAWIAGTGSLRLAPKPLLHARRSVLPLWDGTFRVREEKEVGNGWENRQD
jgi:hypothetical protein